MREIEQTYSCYQSIKRPTAHVRYVLTMVLPNFDVVEPILTCPQSGKLKNASLKIRFQNPTFRSNPISNRNRLFSWAGFHIKNLPALFDICHLKPDARLPTPSHKIFTILASIFIRSMANQFQNITFWVPKKYGSSIHAREFRKRNLDA